MDLSKMIAEGTEDLGRGCSGPNITPAACCCSGTRNGSDMEDMERQHSCSSSPPMDIVFPFYPSPSCSFHHSEFFVLGELRADGKSQPWELLVLLF